MGIATADEILKTHYSLSLSKGQCVISVSPSTGSGNNRLNLQPLPNYNI